MNYATQYDNLIRSARYAVSHIKQWGLYAACRYAKNHGVSAEMFINQLRGKI